MKPKTRLLRTVRNRETGNPSERSSSVAREGRVASSPGVDPLFDERLDAALADDEIKRSLAPLESKGIPNPAAAVRCDVRDELAKILEETKPHREARDRALTRHIDVSHALRGVRRLTRVTAPLAVVGLLLIVGGIADVMIAAIRLAPVLLWGGGIVGTLLVYLWIGSKFFRNVREVRLRLADRTRERESQQERYETVLSNEITAAIRRAINTRVRSMSTEFGIIDTRGLRELVDPEREVPTVATQQLQAMITSLAGGSVGLSGPRGCGKTTLIHRFATGRSVLPNLGRRGLVVSAPVRYDAREFVLHLYARVCELVMNPESAGLALSPREQLRAARRTALVKLQVGFAVAVVAVGSLMLVTHRTVPIGYKETGWFLIVTAAVVAYAAIFILPSDPRTSHMSWWERLAEPYTGAETDSMPRRKPEQLAEQRLEEIRFQQTLASGWSASAGLPLGTKLGGESKLTLARTPWTLPEIVHEFRAHLRTLTDSHYVVIGIDELDKIDSDEDAQRFLNDIKGVFGVRGCYYLVSISEDAMSNFERRGMPFRDVFDSSFDAVLRLRPLSLSETREVLESRVTGLPVPYQCLCHILSGGLPRDVVRVARELVQQQKSGATAMSDLCGGMIRSELRGKVAAAEVLARAVGGRERDYLLTWLQRWDLETPAVANLREQVSELTGSGLASEYAETGLGDLALELMAFSYYTATVLEFFRDESLLQTVFATDSPSADGLSADVVTTIEALARARHQFAMSPALAASGVASFRGRVKLRCWKLPEELSITTGSAHREPRG